MTIVIGCEEICGWIDLLSTQFRKTGHNVISISRKNKYFPSAVYTLDKDRFREDFFSMWSGSRRIGKMLYSSCRLVNRFTVAYLGRDFNGRFMKFVKRHLYKKADLYIHIWEGLEPDDSDLAEFKKSGSKVVSWFVGDDVRYYPVAVKEFDIDNQHLASQTKKTIYPHLHKLRMHEKYSDAIFSVPDQSSLSLRPYFHLQVPIDPEGYNYKNTGNVVPVIVHIPSSPLIKGTHIFERVIAELQSEGLNFEFRRLINIPNAEVRRILTESDILLDELYLHGPGMIGMEAMASGCCTVGRYLESSPPAFRPPVVAVTEHTLKNRLRELILNKEMRERIIRQGREYVMANNHVANVCKEIMDKQASTGFDYYPTYFREKFEPEPTDDLKRINALTRLVMDEAWYKQNIKPGVRAGLIF